MKKFTFLVLLLVQLVPVAFAQVSKSTGLLQVKTANGMLEGIDESGVYAFRGIPFAAPPVEDLRWKEPQPVKNWSGSGHAY